MLRGNQIRRRSVGAALAAVAVLLLQGCGDILQVTDPDIILSAKTKAGAQALRNGVFLRLSQAVNGIQGPDALFMFGGLITDEWRSGDTFVQRNNQDQRVWQPENTFNAQPFRALHRVRTEGERAIAAIRTYMPDSTAAIGSMFALTGYVEALIGEHYCNGTPISGLDGSTIVYGAPVTNDSMFRLAVSNSDSSIAQAALQRARADIMVARGDSGLTPPTGGTPADTARWAADTTRWRTFRNEGVRQRNEAARVRNLANVVKGRALVDLGQFTAAAAAVGTLPDTVPTAFSFTALHSSVTTNNQVWALNVNARRYTMTPGPEGGVGIDFVTPNDPRVPRRLTTSPIFDTSVPINVVTQGLYGQFDPIPIATGVEARLIQAEANLQPGGNRALWLTQINALRTNATLYPPLGTGLGATRGATLTNLADPGNDTARVNTHFRERAFWMFSTGHRLGDMRRLLRQYGSYGFTEGTVYPNGAFLKGGNYGDATMMAVSSDEQNNPLFHGCIDRNP